MPNKSPIRWVSEHCYPWNDESDMERKSIIGYSRVNYSRDNKAMKDMSLTYVYGGHVSKETTQEPPGLSSLP